MILLGMRYDVGGQRARAQQLAQWRLHRTSLCCFPLDRYDIRQLEEVRRIFTARQVDFVDLEVYENLIHPLPDVRKRAFEKTRHAIRKAAALGIPAITTGVGGCNPDFQWAPHPDNWTDGTWRLAVGVFRDLAREAEAKHVRIALEPYVTVPINTPRRMRRFIEEVGSAALGAVLDPVNFVSLENAFRTDRVIAECVDQLSDYAVVAHIKDLAFAPEFHLHMHEAPLGCGIMAIDDYLQRMDALTKEICLMIEHVEDREHAEAALAFVKTRCEQLRIPIQ